ncbi:hypothetical protein C1H76_7538 [Elsinoe australis]|uniref:Uncharacterized protein n=1 Tax=Elsinoe australis TaxID=40998 RepID=A0A4U7AT70_9PEZI|nr:hypothetical protein C1H76_7538 [Elsinoe australis]
MARAKIRARAGQAAKDKVKRKRAAKVCLNGGVVYEVMAKTVSVDNWEVAKGIVHKRKVEVEEAEEKDGVENDLGR